nr:undecaprenyl-diphosphatase [uncultured Tolumonas sp.]
MEALNQAWFLIINANTHTPDALIQLAKILAEWVIYFIPVLLIYIGVKGSSDTRRSAITASAAVAVALLIGQIINYAWPHPRPFMIGLGHTFLEHKSEASFPSDHALVLFTLAIGFISTGLRKLGVQLLLAGIAVSWARVFLGVHFPFDIAGALVVSIPSVWVATAMLNRSALGNRLINEMEQIYQQTLTQIGQRVSRLNKKL